MKRKKFIMEKDILQHEYYDNKLSCAEIAIKFNVNRQMVRYTLKKNGLKLRTAKESRIVQYYKNKIPEGFLWCNSCKNLKKANDFSKNSKENSQHDSYCKKCKSLAAPKYYKNKNKKRLLLKAKLVKYKGNICKKCGIFDLPLVSFQFHHIDGSKKEKQISLMMIDNEKLKEELDKCELLCANCHHQIHFGETKLSDLEVKNDIS